MAKLYDEQGNAVEAFTKEEVDAVKVAAETKASDFEKKLKDMEQEVNPNWKKVREELTNAQLKAKEMEERLVKSGVTLDQPAVSIEVLRQEAAKVADERYLQAEKSRLMGHYSDAERGVVEKYFSKLTTGENVTVETLSSFMAQAEQLAGVGGQTLSPAQRALASSGRPPLGSLETDKTDYSESDAGKNLASRLGLKL